MLATLLFFLFFSLVQSARIDFIPPGWDWWTSGCTAQKDWYLYKCPQGNAQSPGNPEFYSNFQDLWWIQGNTYRAEFNFGFNVDMKSQHLDYLALEGLPSPDPRVIDGTLVLVDKANGINLFTQSWNRLSLTLLMLIDAVPDDTRPEPRHCTPPFNVVGRWCQTPETQGGQCDTWKYNKEFTIVVDCAAQDCNISQKCFNKHCPGGTPSLPPVPDPTPEPTETDPEETETKPTSEPETETPTETDPETEPTSDPETETPTETCLLYTSRCV